MVLEKLIIMDHVLPFYPLMFCPFTPSYFALLPHHHFAHVHQKPHLHEVIIQYSMEWDRHNCLSFWAIFCLFTSLRTQKNKILKKWKKHLDMSSFYTCVSKTTIIGCMLPGIWIVTDIIFCTILGHFLPFYRTIDPKD